MNSQIFYYCIDVHPISRNFHYFHKQLRKDCSKVLNLNCIADSNSEIEIFSISQKF